MTFDDLQNRILRRFEPLRQIGLNLIAD